jgi:hypothetical protein
MIINRAYHVGNNYSASTNELTNQCTASAGGHQCVASFARSAEKFFSNIIYERFVMTAPSVTDFIDER